MRRAAALARVAVLLAAAAALGGCLLPDDRPRVSIEFGSVPDLAGAEVLIDGEVAGRLQGRGRATVTAFPVEKGTHELTLRHPGFQCRPVTFQAEQDAQKIRMVAEAGESFNPNAGGKPTILLRL